MSNALAWTMTILIGAVDFSARLSGQIRISGEEAGAATATFYLTPQDEAEFDAYQAAVVTIDITTDDGTGAHTYRRFTGSLIKWSFDETLSLVEINCRDAYQETIKACASAAAVQALFSGAAVICDAIVPWSDTKPAPSSYYSALLATVQGTCAVSNAGAWRYIPWVIGTPAATFTADDIFDGTLEVLAAEKSDLPAAVSASLTARVNRLYAVDVPLSWSGIDYVVVGRGRGNWPGVQCINDALAGLSGWYVKGAAVFTHPYAGYEIPTPGGGSIFMGIMSPESVAIGLSATMYHRWYQTVDVKYSLTIDLGGASDRDESISDSISSTWDAGAWETAASSDTSSAIYAANDPTPTPAGATGYEALPEPRPGVNTAMLHYPDIGSAGLESAVRHVVAKAVRLAAAGLRNRRVSFSRPVDPRYQIGDVLAVSVGSVAATGQVVSYEDALNIDTGESVTQFTIACPAGNASSAGITMTVPMPSAGTITAPASPTLGNFVGADTETSTTIADDALVGYLCNNTPGHDGYQDTAPQYIPQFRVIMPEISAALRDPATIDIALDVDYSISTGALVLTV